jgi:hypothetical protein
MTCVQDLAISSKKVEWKRQGTCTLVDNEPPSPILENYRAETGWKEVESIQVHTGGGNFLFPKDQLLLVTEKGYKVIILEEKRMLGNLSPNKKYLVWYHHVMPFALLDSKRKAFNTSRS